MYSSHSGFSLLSLEDDLGIKAATLVKASSGGSLKDIVLLYYL